MGRHRPVCRSHDVFQIGDGEVSAEDVTILRSAPTDRGGASVASRPRTGPHELLRAVPGTRAFVAISVAIGYVGAASVVVQAVALGHLLAGAMPGATEYGRSSAFVWLASALALRALTALVGEVVARVGAARAKADLRARLVAVALRQIPQGARDGSGDLATLAGRGLDALDVYIGRCLPDLVLAATVPIALAAAAGVLDWISGVILVVAIGLFPLFGALVGRASVAMAGDRWQQIESLGRQIVDVFEGLPVLRAFGLSAAQRSSIERASAELRRSSLATLRGAFLSALVLDTIASVSVALVAVPLGLRLLDGSVSLAAALAVLIVAPEVFVPLRRASAEFHESTEGLAAAVRVLKLIEAPSEKRDSQDLKESVPQASRPPDPRQVPVSLSSVSVQFPQRSDPVLDDASLRIEPGETVVLLGRNGVGKSTIASLLLGFRSPDRGAVLVGEEVLQTFDLASWRRQLTYLPEHPTLLSASLADNIRLARESASDGEILAALAAIGSDELLDELPGRLAEPIGEGGRPVSAGELQQIALARVLVRPASLYVLDEPTAHLDAAHEAIALQALRSVLDGASALVITHSSIVCGLADRVVALENGRITTPRLPAGELVPIEIVLAGAPVVRSAAS